jgi:hypothetical protein
MSQDQQTYKVTLFHRTRTQIIYVALKGTGSLPLAFEVVLEAANAEF